jgi:hypothetical protein
MLRANGARVPRIRGAMSRTSRRWIALVVVALLLAAWGSREVLFVAREQMARKQCCMRLRECAGRIQALADANQKPPPTLREWAATDPEIAKLFGDDLDDYEFVPLELRSKDAAVLATTVILRETKATHPGTLHALYADSHIDVAPGN